MAILKGPIQFNGKLGGVRSYWDKDLKKQVLATIGGLNKNLIEHNHNLWRVKAMNVEFAACSIWSKIIRRKTEDLSYLKNGRINGKLVKIAKLIQETNGSINYGYRSIESSKFNDPLIGFSMNNAHPFKDVFSVEPEISITEDRREVTLQLNNFLSHLKFKWPDRVTDYRIYLTIFELPDIQWDEFGRKYIPVYEPHSLVNKTTVSEWVKVSTDPIDFQTTATFDKDHLPRERSTVVVAMGLEFASYMQYNTPYVVKDHGTMAILRCF